MRRCDPPPRNHCGWRGRVRAAAAALVVAGALSPFVAAGLAVAAPSRVRARGGA